MPKLITSIRDKEKSIDWVVAVCSISVSVITWLTPSTYQVPFFILAITIIIAVLTISKLWLYASVCKNDLDIIATELENQKRAVTPKVIDVRFSINGSIIVITSKSPFFRHGMQVSLMYVRNDAEETIAIGTITNIQSDNIMQTTIHTTVEGLSPLINDIISKTDLHLHKLKIIPGVLQGQ